MLLRFSVENFLSFNNRVEFSMAASKITRLKEHTVAIGDKRVLKGGFIFGANASGKSNLVKAIHFAKNIVVKGISNTDFNKKHFRIEKENYKLPGVFQFDFVINESAYSYGFAISYVTKEVVDEWLYKIGISEQCIFNRVKESDGNVTIETDLKIKNKEEQTRFNVYLDDIKNNSMRQTLLLSDIANRSPDNSDTLKIFKEVFNWFQNIIVIFPDSRFGGLNRLVNDTTMRTLFKDILTYFDTGVVDVQNEEMDFEKALSTLPDEDRDELKIKISNALVNDALMIRNGKLMMTLQKNDEGNIVAQKMVLNHGNSSDLFDYLDESDGTQRLFDLIPLFLQTQKNKVIIVDEIDRSLHSKLILEYIKLFYKLSEGSSTQLIATIHDSSVMDLDLVRQDEIWFIERQEDHSSNIYSLNRFKERYDKKVKRDYLIGRYGAVPVFSNFSFDEDLLKGEVEDGE